jgi:hypothetical protein
MEGLLWLVGLEVEVVAEDIEVSVDLVPLEAVDVLGVDLYWPRGGSLDLVLAIRGRIDGSCPA